MWTWTRETLFGGCARKNDVENFNLGLFLAPSPFCVSICCFVSYVNMLTENGYKHVQYLRQRRIIHREPPNHHFALDLTSLDKVLCICNASSPAMYEQETKVSSLPPSPTTLLSRKVTCIELHNFFAEQDASTDSLNQCVCLDSTFHA